MAAAGGGDPLLICATLVPKATEIDVLSEADSAVSAAPVMLRAAYHNDAHDKLPRALWQEERTDLAWLPPCRPVKPTPFRDIWLVGKKELKWLYDRRREREDQT